MKGSSSSRPKQQLPVRSSDIFLQYGTICLPSADQPNAIWQPVKIKLDTGSDFNLVSREVLDDMAFSGPYEPPKSTESMTLDGVTFPLETRVKLRWQFHKSMKTVRSRFYVVENAPFDVLIGKAVIAERDLINESRHFLLNLKVVGRDRGKSHSSLNDASPSSKILVAHVSLSAERARAVAAKKAKDLAVLVDDAANFQPSMTPVDNQNSGSLAPSSANTTMASASASTTSVTSSSGTNTAP